VVASHILGGGLVAGDLNQLDGAQHRDPDQLEDGPDGEDQGESVPGDVVTQFVVDDIAGSAGRGGKSGDIWLGLVKDPAICHFEPLTSNRQLDKQDDANFEGDDI
jgi:hypothetical protein